MNFVSLMRDLIHLIIFLCVFILILLSVQMELSTVLQPLSRNIDGTKLTHTLIYFKSGELLGRISHTFECESVYTICCIHGHKIDIDIYYKELVHALTVAADWTNPKVPRSALKHYWSVTLSVE